MPLKFTTTDQAGDRGVKVCVYGKAGMGKTTLVATAPAPIILSAEAGLLTLRKHKIPAIEINSYNDLLDAYQWTAQSAEAKQFQTICLDSISEIAERVLENAKKQSKDPRMAYGALADNTYAVIRMFRDLPGRHVYFTAKQQMIKTAENTTMFGPMMPGQQLGPGIPYFFDEVFNLNIGTAGDGSKYRYLRTQPDFQYDAKDRSGALDEIERPDLAYIFNKILAA